MFFYDIIVLTLSEDYHDIHDKLYINLLYDFYEKCYLYIPHHLLRIDIVNDVFLPPYLYYIFHTCLQPYLH